MPRVEIGVQTISHLQAVRPRKAQPQNMFALQHKPERLQMVLSSDRCCCAYLSPGRANWIQLGLWLNKCICMDWSLVQSFIQQTTAPRWIWQAHLEWRTLLSIELHPSRDPLVHGTSDRPAWWGNNTEKTRKNSNHVCTFFRCLWCIQIINRQLTFEMARFGAFIGPRITSGKQLGTRSIKTSL